VVTNEAFARRVGCNYTMASKIRNGTRKPSGGLLPGSSSPTNWTRKLQRKRTPLAR